MATTYLSLIGTKIIYKEFNFQITIDTFWKLNFLKMVSDGSEKNLIPNIKKCTKLTKYITTIFSIQMKSFVSIFLILACRFRICIRIGWKKLCSILLHLLSQVTNILTDKWVLHCHENYTHLDWIEANECCHMVISSLLNVLVLTSECELRSKFQHISALMIEYISTHDRIYLHSWLSISVLMIEINAVPSKKIVPLSTK